MNGAPEVNESSGQADRPFRPQRRRVEKPDLPDDLEPDLPKGVLREMWRSAQTREVGDQLAAAMTLAVYAIEEGEPGRALPYLDWIKQVAPRSPATRETLGIANYQAGNFRAALNELRAYRRFTNSFDQDHLIADCIRALGHGLAEVADVVRTLLDSDAPSDRKVEGMLVWAGMEADEGDLEAARAVMRRAESLLEGVDDETLERWLLLSGDLAERSGDLQEARDRLGRLADLPDDPYEVVDRLARLNGS